MKHYINERSAGISQGGEAFLDAKWKDKGVLLGESKLFFILEGEIIIKTERSELNCREGDMVLIPAGVKHDYYLPPSASAHKYWFHFSLKSEGASIFDRYDVPFRFCVPEADRAFVAMLFERVLSESESETDALLQISALYELVSYYVKKSGAMEKNTAPDEIDRTLIYINDNLSGEITLPALAARACLSPNYFVRKFKSRFGVSPLKYVSIARMECAKRLLSNDVLSVAEVMTRVGFCDSAHFSKVFKSATGYSPRAFRNVTLK